MLRSAWLVAVLAHWVSGNFVPVDERCVVAIYSAYNYVTFAGLPAKGMWATRCQNPLQVTSIYAASEVYCTEIERVAGLTELKAECEEFGHCKLLSRDDVAVNLTEDAIRNMRTINYLELPRDEAVDTPVLISSSYFDRMFKTIDSWNFEVWSHHAFGYAGYIYWGVILFLGIISRFIGWAMSSRGRDTEHEIESNTYPLVPKRSTPFWVSSLSHWIETHLYVSTPLGKSQEILTCTFSNRAEALAVAGFWVMSVALSFLAYDAFEGNLYWPNKLDQILRYSADRTGIMSFANLPLLWLFGGRNNILIWATNWSFATFNIFHRHVARVATLQAVAHSVIYVIIYFRSGKWWKFLTKVYILWGILGTVVMVLLLVSSFDRIRISSYEFFLITHIFLSVLTLIGCFYHTIVFEGNEYWQYLWPSVGIWAFDRFIRIVRIVYCNLNVKFFQRNQISSSSSWMAYDEVADVIRLEISMRTPLFKLHPGDYLFLYQPLRWTGWESHPFTVGAWTQNANHSPSYSSFAQTTDTFPDASHLPLLTDPGADNDGRDLSDETFKATSDRSGITMTFWIRPYDGWTQELRRQCLKSKSQPVKTTILIEGPYGHQAPVWNYDSMLMIVGGTGIASAVPYLHDHLRRSPDGDNNRSKYRTRLQDIELIWTTKQMAFIGDVAHRELNPLLARPDFKASFYSTGDLAYSPRNLDDLGCSITPERPHLQSIIMSRACDASSAGRSLIIFVCGPASMANEARKATQLAMQQGYRGIKYTEDSFTW